MKNFESMNNSIKDNNPQFNNDYYKMDYDEFVKNTFDDMKIKQDAIKRYQQYIEDNGVLDYNQKFVGNLKQFHDKRQELDLKSSKRILYAVIVGITILGAVIGFGVVFPALASSVALLPTAYLAATLTTTIFAVGLSLIAVGMYDFFYASKLEKKYQQEKDSIMNVILSKLDKKETEFLKSDYKNFKEVIDKKVIETERINYLSELAINKILNDTALSIQDRYNMLANFETLYEKSQMSELPVGIKQMLSTNKEKLNRLLSEIEDEIGKDETSLAVINNDKQRILTVYKNIIVPDSNPTEIDFTSPRNENRNDLR